MLTLSWFVAAARGDRMKQAQADADALIAAYRLEQQDAFDASSVGDGELFLRGVPRFRVLSGWKYAILNEGFSSPCRHRIPRWRIVRETPRGYRRRNPRYAGPIFQERPSGRGRPPFQVLRGQPRRADCEDPIHPEIVRTVRKR